MVGWLPVVQGVQTAGIPRCRARAEAERVGAPSLFAVQQSATLSAGMASTRGGFSGRWKRLDRFLWHARDLEAPFLLRGNARGDERQPSVGRIGISHRTS